jgi:hypothetical protein
MTHNLLVLCDGFCVYGLDCNENAASLASLQVLHNK